MLSFPNLSEDDIEVRVASVTRYNDRVKLDLLLYKDARCDMRILDETVGPERWQRRHETIDGVLFCNVGIKVDDTEWVWKQDCGTAGAFEAEKSKASDAFKRACFNWGIGRELYTAPEISIWQQVGEPEGTQMFRCKSRGEKLACYDLFTVKKCIIEDHIIKALWIVNESIGKTTFVLQPPSDTETAASAS